MMLLDSFAELFHPRKKKQIKVMPFFSSSRDKKRDSLAKPADVCRIAILGDAKTGKTSLVRQFLEFKFQQKYRPTVDDIIQVSYKSDDDGEVYEIELVDATGSFEFPAMRKLYIDTSDAFIVVMSVDLPGSIDEAHRVLQLIRNRRNSGGNSRNNNSLSLPTIPPRHQSLQSELSMVRQLHMAEHEPPRVVFVLNKMDLTGDQRKVSVSDVQYDSDFGYENVVLASAKENWNVDEAFSQLIARHRDKPTIDDVHMEKTLEVALQHRRVTAPNLDFSGASRSTSDNFLLALKNGSRSPHRVESYTSIAP